MLNVTRLTSPQRPTPEPLEANDVAVVTGGTIVWFLLFLVQLPFHGWLEEHGHTWWMWTCLAGFGLGLIGIRYTRGRRAAIRRHRAAAAVEADGATEVDRGAEADRNPQADRGAEVDRGAESATPATDPTRDA